MVILGNHNSFSPTNILKEILLLFKINFQSKIYTFSTENSWLATH